MAKVQLSADFYKKKDESFVYLHLRSDGETLDYIKDNLFKQAKYTKNNTDTEDNDSELELTYKLPTKSVDNFIGSGFIEKLYGGLAQNHIETNVSPEVFKEDIMVAKNSAPNMKVVQNALTKRDNLLEKFFQNYDKEEVKREIAKITQHITINANGDVLKVALLSNKNKLLAYVQNPECTYLASQKTWRTVFKRRVKGGARPIYIVAGNNAGNYEDYATNLLGMNRTQASTNRHTYASYNKAAKYGDTNPTAFFVTTYYDYADTEPYDANYDPFNDDPGLSSNLSGEYNQKAKEAYNDDNGDIESSRQEIRKMTNSESYTEKANIAFNNVVNYCKKHGDEYNSVLITAVDKEPTEGITDVLREMFRISFERVHDKKLQDEKVNICTCFVLASLDIANNSMLNYMATNGSKFNKKDLLNMYSQCTDMINIMTGLNENFNPHPTFKEFLNALGTDLDNMNDMRMNRTEPNQMNNGMSDGANEEIEDENKVIKEYIINFMKRMMI